MVVEYVFISVVFVKSQYFLGSKSISSEALFGTFFDPVLGQKFIHRNTSKNPRARKQQQQHALTKEELACTHSVLLVSDTRRGARMGCCPNCGATRTAPLVRLEIILFFFPA